MGNSTPFFVERFIPDFLCIKPAPHQWGQIALVFVPVTPYYLFHSHPFVPMNFCLLLKYDGDIGNLEIESRLILPNNALIKRVYQWYSNMCRDQIMKATNMHCPYEMLYWTHKQIYQL